MRFPQAANISTALRNLLLWPLLVVGIGAPINSLAPFAALLIDSLTLLHARPKSSNSRWAAAVSLAIVGLAGLLGAPPVIEEGMNGFFPGYPQDAALRHDLPAEFYDKSQQLFETTYPPEPRCRPLLYVPYLLRGEGPGRERFARAYAFSADGVWSAAKYSRQTTSVDFRNIADLRAGFVNDLWYYWAGRCRQFARTRMPFVVRYDLPASYRGSEMCWTGMVMLQDGQGLRDLSGSKEQCMTLEFEAGPPSIFGMTPKGVDLAVKITPPTWLGAWHVGLQAARIGAVLLVLLIFFRPRYLLLALSAAAVTASLIVIDRYDPDRHVYRYPFGQSLDVTLNPVSASNFAKYRVLPIDMDGLRHVAFARSVLWDAKRGDFKEALRGGEDVYVFMPGMRYLEAAALATFGDSEFGPIFFASLTLIGLFYFIATFMRPAIALVLGAAFLCGPKLFTQPFLFDLDIWLHVYFGHWADGASTLAFMTGSAILVRLANGGIAPTFGALAVPGILISAAVLLRANFGLAGLAVMVCSLWQLRPILPPGRLAIVAAGFAFLGTAALHNWFFSGRFVPFTGDVSENLPAHPVLWAKTFGALLGVPLTGSDAAQATIVRHLSSWLGDLANAEFVWPRVAALALLFAFVLFKPLRSPANMTLLAIIAAAQLPLLFFLNTGRYGFIAWPSTLLAAVLVLAAVAAAAIDHSRKWRSIRAAPSRSPGLGSGECRPESQPNPISAPVATTTARPAPWSPRSP